MAAAAMVEARCLSTSTQSHYSRHRTGSSGSGRSGSDRRDCMIYDYPTMFCSSPSGTGCSMDFHCRRTGHRKNLGSRNCSYQGHTRCIQSHIRPTTSWHRTRWQVDDPPVRVHAGATLGPTHRKLQAPLPEEASEMLSSSQPPLVLDRRDLKAHGPGARDVRKWSSRQAEDTHRMNARPVTRRRASTSADAISLSRGSGRARRQKHQDPRPRVHASRVPERDREQRR